MENNIISYLDSLLHKKVKEININSKKDIKSIVNFLQNNKALNYNEFDFPIVKLTNELGFRTFKSNIDETGYLWIGGTTGELYDSNKVILVNNNLNLKQRRYVIANLLSYYVLDYLFESKRDNAKLYQIVFNKTDMNKKADYFAMQLLLPRDLLISKYCEISDEFSAKYGILSQIGKYKYLSGYFRVEEQLIERAVSEILYGDIEIEYNDVKVKKKI